MRKTEERPSELDIEQWKTYNLINREKKKGEKLNLKNQQIFRVMGTVTKDLAFMSQECWEEGRKTMMLRGIEIKNGWTFPRFVKTYKYSISIS